MSGWRVTVSLLLPLALLRVGCATSGENTADPASKAESPRLAELLSGTKWELVEIQSVGDLAAKRPRGFYTMQLGADGTLWLRVDCNKGRGVWSAEPGQDPSQGTLTFKLLSITQAGCLWPEFDQQIEEGIPRVRSYLVKDRRLHLALSGDGSWIWKRGTTRNAG